METLPYESLVFFSIALFILEMFTLTYYLLWIGLSFLLVGGLTYMNVFPSVEMQFFVASMIMIGFFLNQNRILNLPFVRNLFTKAEKDIKDSPFVEGGEGKIVNDTVSYMGTFWKFESNEKFEQNEKVKVVAIKGNTVVIEKV